MRRMEDCELCGQTYEYRLGCSCRKAHTSHGPVITFANPQQPTNKQIDAARDTVRRTLVTTRDTLMELLKDQKVTGDYSIGSVLVVLNQEIQNHI